MTRDHRTGPTLIIALTILPLALGVALVLGQGGAGRAPQNGSGRGNANKTNTPPAVRKTAPAKKTTPAFRPKNPGIELVRIPAGSFMMGSTNGEADEKPVHQVTINYSFFMGKYEVTQAQWRAVMGDNPSHFEGCANCPVETVSWDDAQSFIHKLNQMNDGYTYRLPTEAEWEYACRAGTTGDYAGDLDSIGWYYANAGDARLSGDWNFDKLMANHNRTHPVGTKLPNAFGLFDTHGNVWEWCQDWYHGNYAGAPTDGSAWLSGGEQKYRLLRGGSSCDEASVLRFDFRDRNEPENGFSNCNGILGLRVVAAARTR